MNDTMEAIAYSRLDVDVGAESPARVHSHGTYRQRLKQAQSMALDHDQFDNVHTLDHGAWLNALAYAPDSSALASGGANGKVKGLLCSTGATLNQIYELEAPEAAAHVGNTEFAWPFVRLAPMALSEPAWLAGEILLLHRVARDGHDGLLLWLLQRILPPCAAFVKSVKQTGAPALLASAVEAQQLNSLRVVVDRISAS